MTKTSSKSYFIFLGIAAVILILAAALFLRTGITSTNPINNSNTSSCLYGYECNIKSDGCAVPGAIYNCPNEPVTQSNNNTSGNKTIAVNLTQELKNSAASGFTLNASMFYASSSSECSKEQISSCDNNVPSQFICVNQQYAVIVSSQYNSLYSTPVACPQFFMAGNISCSIVDNYCTVVK